MNAQAGTPVRRLAAAWFALALAALGLSALFAVVLVVARTPFLGQGAGLFRTALVLHVDLSVQVWFLAMAAGLWSLTSASAGGARWTAFWLAAAGTLGMTAAPFFGEPVPLLSNYIPLLDQPLFKAGLASFGAGTLLAALLSLHGHTGEESEPWHRAARFAALAMLAAAMVLFLDLRTPAGSRNLAAGIEDRLWGTGHALQFVHVLLLMGAWCALGDEALARVPAARRWAPRILGLAALALLAVPAIALLHPVGSVEHHAYYTTLMRWGTWPGAAALGLMVSAGLVRLRRERPLSADEVALALSLALFAVGCLLGAAIRGESLAVPAHYHGTVGAVTLAYLVWLRRIAHRLGVAPQLLASTRRLPFLYGAGIAVLVAGLGVGGYLGVPRKAPHMDLSIDNAAYLGAMGAAGLGGLLALTAVAACAALGLRAAWRGVSTQREGRRRDVRAVAVAVTALLVAFGGWLLAALPGATSSESFSPRRHAAERIRSEVEARFGQGVLMLHAKQYEHAMTAFHRVLQLAPETPEAYVNMGFALIGLKRYREARDFFESATLLRRAQVNAYYGLALAYEGLGDYPAALGAMQTFAHLAKPDDPFRRKAEAAIWEWREADRLATGPAAR